MVVREIRDFKREIWEMDKIDNLNKEKKKKRERVS